MPIHHNSARDLSLPEKVPERTLAVRGKARVALDDQHWRRPAASAAPPICLLFS